jgi:putative metallohydrolase (TIGR04338 family)
MRTKAYRAEDAIIARKEPGLGIEGAQRFIAEIMATKWFKKHQPLQRLPVFVRSWSGGKGLQASAADRTIKVGSSDEAMTSRLLMLHEFAHILTPRDVGHGREWARWYCKLVARFMGAAHARDLRASFRAHGIKTRRVTPAMRRNGKRLAMMHDNSHALERHHAERRSLKAAKLRQQEGT